MASQQSDRPVFHALLIAADCYLPNQLPEGSYSSLGGCVRDVHLVEDFLRERLHLKEDQLVKLTSTNAGASAPPEPLERRPTYENIIAAFKDLTQKADPGDHVYVHYSGHGGRTPTLLPDVKGKGGIDEALVPIDIGDSTARYLRDVELAKLLQDMATKGLRVTMVLDSCHSGGATRGPDSAIRGVAFIDQTERPSESLAGNPEELRSSWEAQVGPTAARSLTSAARPAEYILLAACRPSEYANEYAFDGRQRNGALTYWLLDTLKQQGPAPTFQMIHNRVVAKIHEKFPSQSSVLIGDPGRVAFQDLRIEPAFTIPVAAVNLGAKQLTLSAGLSAGLAKGAEFVIYPRTETDVSQLDTRKAWVRLTKVRDSESDAEVVEQFGDQAPEAGDQAVLVGATSQALVRNVRLVRRDLKPLTDEDTALLAIKKALPGNGWVELVEAPEQSASFVVRISEDGAHYEICTPDYEPIRLNPPLAVAEERSPQALVRRLVHLAKYQAVLELENKAPIAALQKKLGVELLALPNDFKADVFPWPEPQPFQEPVPTIQPGQWVCLRIINQSSQRVNVTVLDLQPAWGIAQAYPPDSDYEELIPGGEPLVIPLKASLPESYESGVDTLKVLATVKPTSFRQLALPRLDQPIPPGPSEKGLERGETDPLEQLLDAVSADRPPSRDAEAVSIPGREWASIKVQVRIEGKPK
jgi:hypothetical protein